MSLLDHKHWIIYSRDTANDAWESHCLFVQRQAAESAPSALSVYFQLCGRHPGTQYAARLEYPQK